MGSVDHVGSPAALVTNLLVTDSSGVFYDIVEPEAILWGGFFFVVPFRVSKM